MYIHVDIMWKQSHANGVSLGGLNHRVYRPSVAFR
jgi:hypothetical protein